MAVRHVSLPTWNTSHSASVSANANPYPYDSEGDDEEIDQLISDSDEGEVNPPGEAATSSTTKTRPRPSSERVPGKSLIPHSRIENILESDGEPFLRLLTNLRTVSHWDSVSRRWWSYVKRGHVHLVHCHSEFHLKLYSTSTQYFLNPLGGVR